MLTRIVLGTAVLFLHYWVGGIRLNGEEWACVLGPVSFLYLLDGTELIVLGLQLGPLSRSGAVLSVFTGLSSYPERLELYGIYIPSLCSKHSISYCVRASLQYNLGVAVSPPPPGYPCETSAILTRWV